MLNKYRIPLRINEITYLMISQLCIWSVLPVISSVGAEFLIQNSTIRFKDHKFQSLFLSLRGIEFFIILFVIFSVMLNHFKNAFLSRKTVKKIQERPEELLYKKLLFIYLFAIGTLIFFWNNIKIASVPISVFALVLHLIYAICLLFIQPYKKSLRIHAFALYMNQLLYFCFLVVINLINLVDSLDGFVMLCVGYAITGWVGILLILSFVRLYYEIRYGEDL